MTLRSSILGKRLAIRPVHLTSAISTVVFAAMYGLIEHILLTSPIGLSVLVYPLNIHLVGQIYSYHIAMAVIALVVSFNPFFADLLFSGSTLIKKQAIMWGAGNLLNFIWLEDMFYFVLFHEWPKDVMTPFHISFYGIVWWYPVLLGISCFLYYKTATSIRRARSQFRTIINKQ
jgi:hypothetical protein